MGGGAGGGREGERSRFVTDEAIYPLTKLSRRNRCEGSMHDSSHTEAIYPLTAKPCRMHQISSDLRS